MVYWIRSGVASWIQMLTRSEIGDGFLEEVYVDNHTFPSIEVRESQYKGSTGMDGRVHHVDGP